MEHRWSKRKNLSLPVLIFEHKLPIAAAYSGNVSAGGIYLECGPTNWRINEFLEIEFHDHVGQIRLPGMVIHRSQRGFGLMFSELQSKSRTTLNRILSAYENPQISCSVS